MKNFWSEFIWEQTCAFAKQKYLTARFQISCSSQSRQLFIAINHYQHLRQQLQHNTIREINRQPQRQAARKAVSQDSLLITNLFVQYHWTMTIKQLNFVATISAVCLLVGWDKKVNKMNASQLTYVVVSSSWDHLNFLVQIFCITRKLRGLNEFERKANVFLGAIRILWMKV